MFDGASSFNQPLEFNTENVSDMHEMFIDASSFNQPLEFNTDNIIDMTWIFLNSGMEQMPSWVI